MYFYVYGFLKFIECEWLKSIPLLDIRTSPFHLDDLNAHKTITPPFVNTGVVTVLYTSTNIVIIITASVLMIYKELVYLLSGAVQIFTENVSIWWRHHDYIHDIACVIQGRRRISL